MRRAIVGITAEPRRTREAAMKKKSLSASELDVESFDTSAAGSRAAVESDTTKCGLTAYPTCYYATPRQEDFITSLCC
jgi:hypothetical protein